MTAKSCVIVDYGIGNVFSVARALDSLGAQVKLTNDHAQIKAADRLILPGVGAFGRAVETLREQGLDAAIDAFIQKGRPFLGICVGMQVLMREGLEFGRHEGLGYFEGSVEKVDLAGADGAPMRVPLIGWNKPVKPVAGRWAGTVFEAIPEGTDFYFVHSFAARPSNPQDVAAVVPVGTGSVVAAIQRDNITGVQFHPERSAQGGLAFLNGFMSQ